MPLGMQDGSIRDNQVEACCSILNFPPSNARLNGQTSWTTCMDKCTNDAWIQVRFDGPVAISGIQTQGRRDNDQWVTSYDLMLGLHLPATSPIQWVDNKVRMSSLKLRQVFAKTDWVCHVWGILTWLHVSQYGNFWNYER